MAFWFADEALRSAASSALVIPVADGLSNVNVTCSGAGDEQALSPPCSEGSSCVEGDVGVYCQCYVSESTGNEVTTHALFCAIRPAEIVFGVCLPSHTSSRLSRVGRTGCMLTEKHGSL